MEPASMIGNIVFLLLYAAILVVPIAFAVWFYRSVNRLVEAVTGIRQDIRRIADGVAHRSPRL
jgi:hypothetical protein